MSIPWMTPFRFDVGLDHHRHGCHSLLGRHRGGIRTRVGILRRLDDDCGRRNRFALRLGSTFDFRNGCLERDHQEDPGGATDPEPSAAKHFHLDFAVQEVLHQKGHARDDVRLDYRCDCLPALLGREPLEHARGCAVWMMSAACAVQAPSVSGSASATALGSAA
jgi:hypothetical protein